MSLRTKNLLIVLIGAFVVAILVAMIVQMTVGGKKEQQVVEEEKVSILVAAKDLKMGDDLTPESVRWQSWPAGALFGGAIVRKDQQKAAEALTGRLSRPVSKDEPLTKMTVLAADKGNFVAAMLDPGMRAIAIDVSASSMVGGFIGPGDFVDVVLTYDIKLNYDKDDPLAEKLISENLYKSATETIAQNIRVLAIDQSAVRPEDDAVKIGKTVTLAVDLQTAESMALAQEMGDLTLILRGVGDDKIVSKDWETISDIRMVKVDDEILKEYDDMTGQQYTGKGGQTMQIYNGSAVISMPTSP